MVIVGNSMVVCRIKNNDPKVIAYYFVNCVIDLHLVILQFNDFRSIVLQDFPIISKNSPEHLKLQHKTSK